jgi:DNA-binding NtrC family response regulator
MKGSILVVDDEPAIGVAIRRLLQRGGHDVDVTSSGEDALARLAARRYELVITDLNLGSMSGMEVLRAAKERSPATAVVMITAYGSEQRAVEAMKLGAVDYLPKPFDNDELELVVARVFEELALRRDLTLFREQAAGAYAFDSLVGRSAAMQRVFDVVRKVADTDLAVLIRGPSGTGKELVANAIHYNGPRRTRPLVKVNCAAFSRELVESELFGHERGAFTGATSMRRGKFEVADGGTLLLDEVGDMPLETQAKILRALQEQEFERVGGNRPITVDVRVLAATNQDLEAKVGAGTFREDLYYRLKVVTVVLPALRERPEDLPLLIDHFVTRATERLGRGRRVVGSAARRLLLEHDWPGNVRELEHALEHAVALASTEEIGPEDLPATVREQPGTGGQPSGPPATAGSFKDAKRRVVEAFERRFLTEALTRNDGNVSRTAEDIGIYRQHLQQKLSDYGIDAASFRPRGTR